MYCYSPNMYSYHKARLKKLSLMLVSFPLCLLFLSYHLPFLSCLPCFISPMNFIWSSAYLVNISICRLLTRWLPTWTWRSAASLCCPETGRKTAAWTSYRLIAPWPFWLLQKGKATIISTLRLLTVFIGRLLSSWPLTLCRAPRLIFGGWFLTTAAQQWSCSTSSTSPTLPGWGQRVSYFFYCHWFVDTIRRQRCSTILWVNPHIVVSVWNFLLLVSRLYELYISWHAPPFINSVFYCAWN